MSRHGWGLVGICGAILVALALPYLDAHPMVWWGALIVAATGFVVGLGLIIVPPLFLFVRRVAGRRPPQPRQEPALIAEQLISLQEAAQLGYEAEENAGLRIVVGARFSTQDVGLDHYKYVLLSARAPMIGVMPPSRQQRPIPLEEYSSLTPVPGESALMYAADLGLGRPPTYISVAIRRSDMQRAIDEHITATRSERALRRDPRR